MIELTTAAYFTLIGLSVLAGYALHGIIREIKKGEFLIRRIQDGSNKKRYIR